MNDLNESDRLYMNEATCAVVERMAREVVGKDVGLENSFIAGALKYGRASRTDYLTYGDVRISVRLDISKSEIEV